ncbi:MAG: hypothetical protein KFB96_12935 [Thiocapsa sp.]|uniref:phBC6A51 family helix-turn-helix protein n=1 Tax=Thiocapsa sp. TaxID=2024551 RepID=UPI001BCF3931|nr:phBC6A51 family helix-turn-helix protein [Thiocapsa sp.]QVL46678.1 MAG: hypothetical protein KFB96_12935 [Thiocapsa sp.]
MAEAVDIENGLTEVQIEAARLLACGCKATDVASECGVDESTISRWRRKPAFAALVQRITSDAHLEVVGRMGELLHLALDVIEESLRYPDPSIRLRGAVALLNVSGLGRTMKVSAPIAPGDIEAAG